MNKNIYRLVFSKPRGMLVAVEESATAAGKTGGGETIASRPVAQSTNALRALLHTAFGTLVFAGGATVAHAQIVPGGNHAPSVIQTQNGLPQVNINRPSGAGVSLNTYGQFDVQKNGAILNNSPTIVSTQQAGYINGNPNFLPGQSAKIIVNQVNSNNPSQLRGYVEVGGSKAEVVIANSSGLVVDGGGFINTSRAILTTGTPTFDANGSLTGFDVTGGQVTVQGAGLNATNVDQVDLIARAVQANAAIYGNTLNVVAGANHVDHDTLAATPITGNGPAPSVAIDVSQLGGMYANRIFLTSNEYGVGVSNAGVLAAQAGDLTLTTQGRLVLSGRTTTSGNLSLTAAGGVQNDGTTYAQQGTSVSTAADLTNTGTLGAQQNTTVNAGSVNSSGTLGAGINSDGSTGTSGDLTVASTGALTASGHLAAGGNASLAGAGVNLAGSQTSANGSLAIDADAGNLNLAGATATAGSTLSANASGTLTNDGGVLSSSGAQTITAGAVSNQGGQIVSQSTLSVNSSGSLTNVQGVVQAAGHETIGAASLDNTGGRVVSLNADGLSVTTSGALVNAAGTTSTGATGGVIGTNGALDISAGSIANQAQIDAGGDATVQAHSLDNHAGSVVAGGALNATIAGALGNQGGALSGSATTVSAASADNSNGTIEGNQLALSTSGNLVNRGGHLNQYGSTAQTVTVGGALDNTGGTIASNAGSLGITAQSLTNDSGTIQHAGTGTLNVTTTGGISNTGGTVVTDGTLNLTGGAVSNQGTVSARGDATLQAQSFDNHAGSVVAGGNLSATVVGALGNQNGTLSGSTTTLSAASADNSGGLIDGDHLALSTTGNLTNQGGAIRQYSSTDQTLDVGGTLDNTSGTIASNATNLTVSANTLTNDGGSIQHAGTGTLGVSAQNALSNTGGAIVTNGSLSVTGGAIANQGQLAAGGNATVQAQSLDNHAGSIVASGDLGATVAGALDNQNGTLSGSATTVLAASADNTGGTIEGYQLALSTTGNLTNRSGGSIRQFGDTDQTVSAGGALDNTGGTIASNATDLTVSGQSITNDAGSIQHAGTGTLAVTTPGALSDVGGQIATNGALNTQSSSLDNTNGMLSAQGTATVNATTGLINQGGTLYGKTGLSASTQGTLNNSSGSAQTGGNLSLTAGGALSNAHGSITANGSSGTLNVSGSSIDNTAGTLTNNGTGTTIVSAASTVTNTGGTLGGNGDVTLNAQTLVNTANAKLVSAGAANLNVTSSVNNAGGTIYGGTALNLNEAGATATNTGGQIEGGQDVSVQVGALSNAGGALKSNRNMAIGGALSGDGTMISGGNLTLAASGDYTNTAADTLHADGNLSVSATGALTNAGTLTAGGALTASGANVTNQAGADMNGATTTVNASGTLANAGRIEGNTVTTNSATLVNTGTVIGNNVQVNATDVQNNGAAAAIAGAQNVDIYASNSVSNTNGALIYSGGNLQIARDGTRDGSGMLADQTGTLTNSASSIQAGGDIDIAARTVNNIRTGVITQAGTPQSSGSTTLTLWTAGLDPTGIDMGYYQSTLYPTWYWNAGAIGAATIGSLMQPITVTVPKSLVTNLNTASQSFSLTQPLTDTYIDDTVLNPGDSTIPITRNITSNPTQYYNSITDNGSTYTITLWPDYNPNTNIRPDQVSIRTDLGTDNHDYVEMSRTVSTSVATDQLISAGTQATIQAQGSIRINADNGSVNNNSSTMAAGGNLIRRANGGSVNDTGIVLQQTVTTDTQSTYYWHQKTGGSTDTKTVDDGITQSTTTVGALPAIATSNGSVQTTAQSINIGSANRVGQTVAGSGVTGGDATGTQLGSVNGQTAVANTASAVSGHAATAGAATGAGGMTVRPQTLGSASSGIPNLTLPVNGLYMYQTSPSATYLVATDPRLTSYTSFVSSDYMLDALNLNPQTTEKRLGDGSYEEQLVMNQVTQLTGRTFLAGYSDNMDEYTALMNNGVTYAKEFGLTPGVGLTDAQMKQLTTDMVWLVSQTVTLPDGTQQTVLVPKVYLAQSDTVDLQDSGALVAGNSVSLNATGNVNNSGHIVGDVATTVLGNNIVNSGVIGSGGTTTVSAVQDVTNVSGRIGGVQTVVQAGRDVIDATAVASVSKTLNEGGFTSSASSQGALATGTISATGDVAVLAGRDINLAGASVQAGNNALLGAGRDINVGTITTTATQDAGTSDGLNGGHDVTTKNIGSAITAGGGLTTLSGRDTTLTDATVQAGGTASIVAGNDLTVTAAEDTQTHNEQSLGGKIAQHQASSYDETTQASNVNAGQNLLLGAGQSGTTVALLSQYGVSAMPASQNSGNLSVLGSNVTTGATAADGTVSGGGVQLVATGDVTVGAVTETHDSQSWSHYASNSSLGQQTISDQASSHQTTSQGSTVSGDTVSASAGNDLTVAGSTIASTHDLSLSAGHDLTITTTQDTSQSSQFHEETASGFGGAGDGLSYGNSDQKQTAHDSSVAQNSSVVGSTDGSVTLVAGNNLHVTGSDLIAAQDITGKAANVTIDSAAGTQHHDDTEESKTSGFTLGAGGSLVQSIETAADEGSAAKDSQDSRAKALHEIAAAGNAGDAAGQVAMGGKPDVSAQLSWGTSQSKNTFTEDQTTQTGSSVKAGGTASFIATGDGTAGSGNVTIAGSDVSANNVLLGAKNQVNLVNTTNTDSTRSTNESSGVSLSVSYGTNGWGGSASMSKANGNASSDAVTQNNTHITGTTNVSIVSGGDTNIVGADVSGNHVSADIGGNLNIVSVQDTTVSSAHQSSSGGSVSASQGGGFNGSFSSQHGSADGSYANVTEQAGIQAGSGGFDITVKGNTGLTGGYISSGAEPSKNTLTTGTLTYSDILNHSDYNASTSGFSAGTQGGMPMISQSDNGHSSGTTRSGVSAGTITVTDAAGQTQDLAGLNRDTSNLNGTVSKTPDVNTLLSNESDVMNAATAAGQAVAKDIGTFSSYKEAQARDGARAATLLGEDQIAAQYMQDAADWGEGGDYRVGMHIVAGAVLGGLGGGSVADAIGGAAAAGVSAKLAPDLNSLSRTIADADPTGNAAADKILGNVVSNVIAGTAGTIVGGNAGGFTASNEDMYNRQLHPQEKTLAQKIAANAAAQGITNPDGSPVTVVQIENAMRAANNSQYGESVATGVVVPLNANTPATALYDTTGMQFTSDSAGNSYEVQNPSLLGTPSQTLQNLIAQGTGGAASPYSWNPPPPTTQATAPSVDPNGPFSSNWNTGDYSAGLGTSYRGLAPDYATVGSGSLSASGGIAVNLYDGSTYVAGGVTQSNPGSITIKPGGVASLGWIFGAGSASSTNSFLNGDGNQAYISIPTPLDMNAYLAVTHSYGGSTALELGVASPGKLAFGFSPFSHSTPVIQPSRK